MIFSKKKPKGNAPDFLRMLEFGRVKKWNPNKCAHHVLGNTRTAGANCGACNLLPPRKRAVILWLTETREENYSHQDEWILKHAQKSFSVNIRATNLQILWIGRMRNCLEYFNVLKGVSQSSTKVLVILRPRGNWVPRCGRKEIRKKNLSER